MLNPTTKETLADVNLTMFRKTPKNWNVGSFSFSDLPLDMRWFEVTYFPPSMMVEVRLPNSDDLQPLQIHQNFDWIKMITYQNMNICKRWRIFIGGRHTHRTENPFKSSPSTKFCLTHSIHRQSSISVAQNISKRVAASKLLKECKGLVTVSSYAKWM